MNFLKKTTFLLFGLLLVVLIIATIVEKIFGTSFAFQHIYHSQCFLILWTILSVSALVYILKRKMYRRVNVFLLHLSFLIILIGALFTHILSEEGSLHLRKGAEVSTFIDNDGNGHKLPFYINLESFTIEYYSGTHSPSDYISGISLSDNGKVLKCNISMNNILQYGGFRFYQAGYDEDGNGTTLLVSHDPLGIGITYIGYGLFFLSMILFFFSSRSYFKVLLSNPLLKKTTVVLLLLIFISSVSYSSTSKTVLPEDVASKFNDVCVMYNGRITPMQTLMNDCLLKVYGSSSYKGYSANQVFVGLLISPEQWENEKIIKINDKTIRESLNINGKYASFNDFFDADGNDKLRSLNADDKKTMRAINEAEEKISLLYMALDGELFRLFPYNNGNTLYWTFANDESLSDEEHRKNIDWLAEIGKSIEGKNYVYLDDLLKEIKEYQQKTAADMMPTSSKIKSEIIYNSLRNHSSVAITLIVLGIIAFIYFAIQTAKGKIVEKSVTIILNTVLTVSFIYITALLLLRWYISSHIPLSNGFETMQFTSWCFIVLALLLQKKIKMILSFGLILSGLALMVSTFGEENPQITHLMPVLSSPLLSIHVVVIMISYSLLAFMMLNGIMAFAIRLSSNNCSVQIERLCVISNILLYPALFLLACGIFIGAIWANVSWGTYWGWDPKEVWALITMLVYSLALHKESLPLFNNTMFFHLFSIIAFITVLITYFGVNFILGGMHSYA